MPSAGEVQREWDRGVLHVPPSPAGPGICPPPVHAGEVQREWDIGVLLCPLPLQALAYALHQSCRGGTEGVG